MIDGNVGGVSGNGDAKWNKKLAEELDALDGKKDGNIKANIWNGFIQKTGSKGNKIHNFIRLNNAERSFSYYDRKKDAGVVDWKNWEAMLKEYKKDLGIEIGDDDNGGGEGGDTPVTNVTTEQQAAFDELETSGSISPKKFDAESLKAGGFGATKTNEHMQQDENGLYYMLDTNGGKNYVNEAGESIRISTFEAGMVEGGKVEVTTTSADGKVKNSIIYGENDKPLSGYTVVTNADKSSVTYKYEFDAEGKKVLKECLAASAPVEESGDKPAANVTPEQQAAFEEAFAKSGITLPQKFDNNYLKDAGFGKTKLNEDMKQDENGLYYQQDIYGGRLYQNDAGEIIQVSEYEASKVEGGKVAVHTLGDIQNNIIYNEEGMPISGSIVVFNDDNTCTTYKYEFDGDKRVLKECSTEQLPDLKQLAPSLDRVQDIVKDSPAKLVDGKFPKEEDLLAAGYKKKEDLMTTNGGILYANEETGEVFLLSEADRFVEYINGNTIQKQGYDADGNLTGGRVYLKDGEGGFTIIDYGKNEVSGVMEVYPPIYHEAPQSAMDYAADGLVGHKANLEEFCRSLDFPNDLFPDLESVLINQTTGEGFAEKTSSDGNYKVGLATDNDGNMVITYSKLVNGEFKEIGKVEITKEEAAGSLRGYDYSFSAKNTITGHETNVSAASWEEGNY